MNITVDPSPKMPKNQETLRIQAAPGGSPASKDLIMVLARFFHKNRIAYSLYTEGGIFEARVSPGSFLYLYIFLHLFHMFLYMLFVFFV